MKKYVKRIACGIIAAIMMFGLVGCGGNSQEDISINHQEYLGTNYQEDLSTNNLEDVIVGTWEDEEDENVVLFTKDGVYFMCSTNPEFYYSYYIADYTYEDGELTFDDYEYENGYEVRWVFWNVEESLDYLFGNGDCALIDGYFYVYLGGNIHKFSKISDNVDYNKDIYDNFKIYR